MERGIFRQRFAHFLVRSPMRPFPSLLKEMVILRGLS
jgi:hypothetical protein